MFAWNYSILYRMAINEASLIVVEGNQLLDTTIVASLAILLSSARVNHTHKMLWPKVRVMVTKTVAIRAMVMVLLVVVIRPEVNRMPWMLMSSRVVRLVSLKGINQDHLVIMSIELMRLSQKTDFKSCSLQSIALHSIAYHSMA